MQEKRQTPPGNGEVEKTISFPPSSEDFSTDGEWLQDIARIFKENSEKEQVGEKNTNEDITNFVSFWEIFILKRDNLVAEYLRRRRLRYTRTHAFVRALEEIGLNQIIRYHPKRKRWLAWTGEYWQPVDDEDVISLVLEIFHELDAPELPEDVAVASSIVRTLQHSSYFRFYPISDSPSWNPDERIARIPVLNGILNVSEEKIWLEPHDKRKIFTYVIPIEWQEETEDPEKFLQFLFEVLDSTYIPLVLQFFGTVLVPDLRHQRALLLFGRGGNGKSTLLEVIREVIGRSLITTFRLDELSDRFKTAELEDKLANFGPDLSDDGRFINTGVFKALTAGDSIMIEEKFKQPRQFIPKLKFAFAVNELPKTSEKSYGFLRRWLLVPMMKEIPPEKMDFNLPAKLLKERERIFGLLVEQLQEYIRNGFDRTAMKMVEENIKQYYTKLSHIASWCIARLKLKEDSKIDMDVLYQDFLEWCESEGIRKRFREDKSTFRDQLEDTLKRLFGTDKNIMVKRSNSKWRAYGIELIEE